MPLWEWKKVQKVLSKKLNTELKFLLFVAEKSAKISASGQTCGQRRKMGLFNPRSREEQALYVHHENARFREDLRENKRKEEILANLLLV